MSKHTHTHIHLLSLPVLSISGQSSNLIHVAETTDLYYFSQGLSSPSYFSHLYHLCQYLASVFCGETILTKSMLLAFKFLPSTWLQLNFWVLSEKNHTIRQLSTKKKMLVNAIKQVPQQCNTNLIFTIKNFVNAPLKTQTYCSLLLSPTRFIKSSYLERVSGMSFSFTPEQLQRLFKLFLNVFHSLHPHANIKVNLPLNFTWTFAAVSSILS